MAWAGIGLKDKQKRQESRPRTSSLLVRALIRIARQRALPKQTRRVAVRLCESETGSLRSETKSTAAVPAAATQTQVQEKRTPVVNSGTVAVA